MSNEIMIFQAVNALGQAVGSVADIVSTKRHLRKQDVILVEERLRYLKAACQMRAYGELVRQASDEMARTLRHYESSNYPEAMQGWLAGNLQLQYDALTGILRDYRH